jgi:glycosyltransferase involved in cell wall biosynthesis
MQAEGRAVPGPEFLQEATSMRVTVSSHGQFHAFHLARQLQRHGVLERLVTSDPRALMEPGIPVSKVRTFPLSEAVMRLPRRVPSLRDRLPWTRAKSRIHDFWAAGSLGDPDLVVAWSGAARRVILAAQQRGALTLIERGSTHIAHQDAVLREEAARFGQTGGVDPEDVREELVEYALADYIMVPSQFARRTFLSHGFDPERVLQVPYGADLSVFSPGVKTDDVFRVVFVGALGLRKGVPYLLEAFRRLKLPKAELVLAGNAWPEMAPILKQYEGSFRAVGSLGRREVATLLQQSSVFVFPSVEEGLALALREALASGLPIIATPDSGAEDVFDDGQEGFLVPPRDVDALCERIERLYRSPELRDEMARRAAARARAWTWEDYGDAVVRTYERVSEARAGRVA